jgi:hypothetical protein
MQSRALHPIDRNNRSEKKKQRWGVATTDLTGVSGHAGQAPHSQCLFPSATARIVNRATAILNNRTRAYRKAPGASEHLLRKNTRIYHITFFLLFQECK